MTYLRLPAVVTYKNQVIEGSVLSWLAVLGEKCTEQGCCFNKRNCTDDSLENLKAAKLNSVHGSYHRIKY